MELRDDDAASTAERPALEVRTSTAADDAARDVFVAAHAQGSFFHLAGWRRAVERAFGHEGCDLLAWRGGHLVGVLPLMRCARPFRGANLISVPYGVYGGPLGDAPQVEAALIAEAVAQSERERVGRLELRCRDEPALPPGVTLERHDLYATFVCDLPDDPAEVTRRMPKRARAEVRKARDKFGLTLSEGAWYVDDLVRMFHSSKRSLGSPGLPAVWFQSLLDEFGERAPVHLVRAGGEAVAATMSFVLGDTLYLYYIGTSAAGNRTYKATHYVCTALQELCVERGIARFDLGRSRVDSGPYSFKKHQGFEPQPLAYRLKLVRDRSKPAFNPSNPKTKVLRNTWSRMPMWLTQRLSARLSRYLP